MIWIKALCLSVCRLSSLRIVLCQLSRHSLIRSLGLIRSIGPCLCLVGILFQILIMILGNRLVLQTSLICNPV